MYMQYLSGWLSTRHLTPHEDPGVAIARHHSFCEVEVIADLGRCGSIHFAIATYRGEYGSIGQIVYVPVHGLDQALAYAVAGLVAQQFFCLADIGE